MRFLIAILYSDSLESKTTTRKIKLALEGIRNQTKRMTNGDKSEILDQAYEDAMTRIKDQNVNFLALAEKSLSWIVHCKTPLTTFELQHALAVEIGMSEFDHENIPETNLILSVCAGLVTIDNESNIVRLAHYTTQEYFERKWIDWFDDPQGAIAEVCVTYLSFDTFASGPCEHFQSYEDRLRKYHLYRYAAQYWGDHSRSSSSWRKELPLVLKLLEHQDKLSASFQATTFGPEDSFHQFYNMSRWRALGVHVAAYFGLWEAIAQLLENGHDPDPIDDYRSTPLLYAAKNGHAVAVEALLASEHVNPNYRSRDGFDETPLHAASKRGHSEVVKRLLASEVIEIDPIGHYGQTPLWLAALNGQVESMRLLIMSTKRVDVNSADRTGDTPLHATMWRGQLGSARLLLATAGIDPNIQNAQGETPLHIATEKNQLEIVRLLLATDGIVPNIQDAKGRTPLHLSAKHGYDEIVKVLLTARDIDCSSAEATSRNLGGLTPLHLAAFKGRDKTVELLLATEGVQVNFSSAGRLTALHLAALSQNENIVKLLLAKGAEVNSKAIIHDEDEDGILIATNITPLHIATSLKDSAMTAELLLAGGAEVNANCSYDILTDFKPMHMAAYFNNEEAIEMLLEWGADINSKARSDSDVNITPLSIARREGYETVERLLLEHGAEDS